MKHSTAVALLALVAVAACDSGAKPEPMTLPVTAGVESVDPAFAIDAKSGDLLFSWVEKSGTEWDVSFARSKDQGRTWSKPVRITPPGEKFAPHSESAARLAAAPSGVLAVVWSTSVDMPGRQWPASDIRFARSTDGGTTWSAPVTINDDTTAGPSGHLFQGLSSAGDNGFAVAWLDSRATDSTERAHAHHDAKSAAKPVANEHAEHVAAAPGAVHDHTASEPDARVMVAQSTDGGGTWTKQNVLAAPDACPCCRITLVPDGHGGVLSSWRKDFGADVRDVVIASILPSPVAPVRVHEDRWVYPGCPHAGPGMTVAANGSVHIAWFTGVPGKAGIFYASSRDGKTFSDPVSISTGAQHATAHASVAVDHDNRALVAWDVTAKAQSGLSFAFISGSSISHQQLLPGTDGADHPQTIALPSGGFALAWAANQRVSAIRVQ